MDKQSTTDWLNRLVHLNREAEAGLLDAAKTAKNSEIETLFDGIAKQHAKFVAELNSELGRQGGSLRDTTANPVGEALHRGWMDLKAALSGTSVEALLASCEGGEQSAEVAYTDAIEDNPTGRVHSLLSKHLHQIQEFRARLNRLMQVTKDGASYQNNDR